MPWRWKGGTAQQAALQALLKRGVYELDPDAPHPRDASVYGCTDTGGKSATVLWARRVGVPDEGGGWQGGSS